MDEVGHADIYMARAQIVTHFLQTDFDRLVFLDDDISFEPFGLIRLLSYDVDCVAVPYVKRKHPPEFMFRSDVVFDRDNPLVPVPDGPAAGLCEVAGMPAGIMSLKRGMLEKMWRHYYDEHVVYDQLVPDNWTVRMFDPYRYTDDEGRPRTLSEDYSFCQRWRDIGGKVYLEPNIKTGHHGSHMFRGDFTQFVQQPRGAEPWLSKDMSTTAKTPTATNDQEQICASQADGQAITTPSKELGKLKVMPLPKPMADGSEKVALPQMKPVPEPVT